MNLSPLSLPTSLSLRPSPQVQKAGSWGEESWGGGGFGGSSSSSAPCRKGTISQYFSTLHCPVCQQLTQLGVCGGCRGDAQRVAVTLQQDLRTWESQQEALLKVSRGRAGQQGAEPWCDVISAVKSAALLIQIVSDV